MVVVGIGTDIIECSRIRRMLDRHGEHFLNRVFTSREITYCQMHKHRVERFAGRFAAKEAILKCLGTGWQKGISWLDVEVHNEAGGRPVVSLGGEAREHAVRLRISDIHISILHCREYATAYALAVGKETQA